MAATEREIDDAIRKRAPKFRAEAESITMRIVRRLLEEDLGLPAGSLEPQKKYISAAVDRVLNEETRNNGEANNGANAETHGDPRAGITERNQGGETTAEKPEVEEEAEASEEGEDEGVVDHAVEESGEEEQHVRRIQKKGLKSKGTTKRRHNKHKHSPDDEEEETESAGPSEGMDEEEEVVKRRSRKKIGKGRKRPEPEPPSDDEESAEESGSSEDGKAAPRKRRKKGEGGSSEAESDKSSDSEEEGSWKQKSRKEALKKKGKDKVPSKPSQAAYLTSKRVVELKGILKQCGITVPPAVYKKAKDADAEERQDVLIHGLKDLLKKEGLSGHPSEQEIKRVRKRLQTQKELEGIDTENIIEEGGRGSRRAAREVAAKVPRYTEESESDEGDEGEEESSAGEEEEDDDEE